MLAYAHTCNTNILKSGFAMVIRLYNVLVCSVYFVINVYKYVTIPSSFFHFQCGPLITCTLENNPRAVLRDNLLSALGGTLTLLKNKTIMVYMYTSKILSIKSLKSIC